MKPIHPSHRPDDEHNLHATAKDVTGQHNDERERANDGDWDSLRTERRTDNPNYDDTQNDNSGGAGSTGSAATNNNDSEDI